MFMFRQPRIPRTPAATEEPDELHKRLTAADLEEISEEFHEWRPGNGRKSTSRKRIEVTLEFLSSGSFYRKTGKAEGVAKSTVILHTREVCSFLRHIAPTFIRLPDPEEYNQMGQVLIDIHNRAYMVIVIVDGVIVPSEYCLMFM